MPLLEESYAVHLERCLCSALAVSAQAEAAPPQGWGVQAGGELALQSDTCPRRGLVLWNGWTWSVEAAKKNH